MIIKKGKLSFDWEPAKIPKKPLTIITYDGESLENKIGKLLNLTDMNIGHPLRTSKRRVRFHPDVEVICKDIFNIIKDIIQKDKDIILAAYLATILFQCFTPYWNILLFNGQHLVGIALWKTILDFTRNWEKVNNVRIHKGTPYFFLAENYLVIGDRDNGFVSLYNALEDDKLLPSLGYPEKAPAYFTAKMLDNPNNHMYYFIVRELRLKLSSYLSEYRKNFNPNFTLKDFDVKFLMNQDIENTVYFFTYNFFFLYDLDKHNTPDLLQNDFSKIRTLDFVFNLAIFIDEILKLAASQRGIECKTMYQSLRWLICNQNNWMNETALKSLIDENHLKLNSDIPDNVIPILVSNLTQPGVGDFRKKIHVMFLAYHLRNHGGHNLDQQHILAEKYDDIINALFMALFLSIEQL